MDGLIAADLLEIWSALASRGSCRITGYAEVTELLDCPTIWEVSSCASN
jgi:hypothetical protein